MKSILLIALILNTILLSGQTKQICISIDDLPVVSYGINDSAYQKDLFIRIVSSLKKNHVPAIGFVNEKKLYKEGKINQYQVDLLKFWLDNGLGLGNHTYSHPDINNTSFSDYFTDLIKGEAITKAILTSKEKSLKYFRAPFLHTGSTKAKSDSLYNFLSEHGYKMAPVTIDNDDYLFALAYHRLRQRNDTCLLKQLGKDYISYMENKLKYFENQAIKLFNRNINQILLIHASLLNSDYLDSLIDMYKKNNYRFVTMDEALIDKAYQTEISVYGKMGISWLDRWALSMGKKGDFFKDEPEVPEYVKQIAK